MGSREASSVFWLPRRSVAIFASCHNSSGRGEVGTVFIVIWHRCPEVNEEAIDVQGDVAVVGGHKQFRNDSAPVVDACEQFCDSPVSSSSMVPNG